MVDKVFSAEAASKFLKWIFGKDSTAVATWATIGLGWVFYAYVYKPERDADRRARTEESARVAAEYAKGLAEVRALSDARQLDCSQDKERLFKSNEDLMRRIDTMLERRSAYSAYGDTDVVASPSPFDCDP